jgi:adenylyltransferase/sulfurtransferase
MDTVREFTPEEQSYYSRHLILSGFGLETQSRLATSLVAIVGLGGLGCPAVAQLAASGVGSLRLIDSDAVDLSNILRQTLYTSEDIGQQKACVAADRVSTINYVTGTTSIARPFESDYLEGCDLVLDCTDNLAARESIAMAARSFGIPLIHGAAIGYEGRMAAFDPTGRPCLGCLLPPDGAVDTCGESGVFAPVTNVIGSLMAAEAIKRLGKVGIPAKRLIVYDGLGSTFHEFDITPSPNCRICGHATINDVSIPTISVAELAQKISRGEDFVLLDIREVHELAISRLDPCLHIPMNEVLWKARELPKSADICVLCRTGNRSTTITQALRLRGFTNVRNVTGGINAYANEIDRSLKTY